MSDVDPRLDFRDLRTAHRVPVFWGPSRSVLNRVMFGVARAVSPSPYWVEIRGREPETDQAGPADLGWIAPDRLFHLGDSTGSSARGSPPSVEFALISFLRDPTTEPIAKAMRLPPLARPLGPEPSPSAPLNVVAVANVDRIDQLYPETPGAMRAVVRAFVGANLAPFFSTLRPSQRRAAADFVFEVTPTHLSNWNAGKLVCEKAPEGSSWKLGDSISLRSLPSVTAALSGKLDVLGP